VTPAISHGWTPNEIARLLRVRPDRVRGWIQNGELGAVNTAPNKYAKPRYVILPHQLEQFERRRSAAPPPKTPRRKKLSFSKDYFPDEGAEEKGGAG
jgi:hypothetical protein